MRHFLTGLFAATETESGHGVGDTVGPGLGVGRTGLEDDIEDEDEDGDDLEDDPERVDDAREEAEEGEEDVDEQLAGDAVHHEHGNRRKEEAKEKSQDSVGLVQCHVGHSGCFLLFSFVRTVLS